MNIRTHFWRPTLVAFALALGSAAHAQSTPTGGNWGVARDCIPDVVRLCHDVVPGSGRINACVKQKIGQLSSECFDVLLSAMFGKAAAPDIRLNPGPIPGNEVHTANARDYACCEIAPVIHSEDGIRAEVYNTTGTTGPGGGCPPEPFAAIKTKELAEKLDAALVYMNPNPQTARRHWVMDENWVYSIGETIDFDGVQATWMASMTPLDILSALNAGPYFPTQIYRHSKYLYAKGSAVFLMRAPEGKVWVMQSYANEVDPTLALAQLPELGAKLKDLPKDWTFEVKTLDRDLTVEPERVQGVARIVRDELHDVYEGCGFDAACNYVP
jgi:hypothetical protein